MNNMTNVNHYFTSMSFKEMLSKILPIFAYMVMVFGLLSIFLNFYVILILWSTTKYSISIPHVTFNGNYAMVTFLVVFLAGLIVYIIRYKNLILSLIANSMLFTVGYFIYTSLNSHADDFGIVMKNRFFHVYYDFTMDEKLDLNINGYLQHLGELIEMALM